MVERKNTGFLKEKDKSTYNPDSNMFCEIPPFPKTMMLELTNACNHRCVFCYNKHSTRKLGMIDGVFLETVLRDAFQLGTREVGFYMTGESLLYPDIDKCVGFAKQLGYDYIYLTTNGALLKPDTANRLISAGIDSIKFSCNAATRETYHKIHGKDDFQAMSSNLRYLLDYREKHALPLKIGVSCILNDENRHEKQLFEDTIGKWVDDYIILDAGNQGGYMNNPELPPVIKSPPCSMLFNRIHVTYEGYYTLCCVDYQNYLVVADLKELSLAEAWLSPLAVSMRKRHLESRLQGTLCHSCIYGSSDSIKPLKKQFASLTDIP